MQGKLDFKAALRERVALLSGLDEDAIARCLAERVVPNPGAATLVRTMRVGGARSLLVSGGFLSFAEPVGKLIGFDKVRANRLVFDGTQLSGRVEDPIVDAQAKLDSLVEARDELGLMPAQVMAIGDGANDRLMIEEAGLGVAFRGKPALAEVADARIDHHGLDALLWAQGIRKKEWVRG
jgi:phosphoserine phosphatase